MNPPVGQYAPVNGLELYYEIHGEGFPLVLVHGGGSTVGTSFGRVLPLFAETHKVIAVEMQAHGHTKDIDRPLSFYSDASDIAALLDHLGIDKANLFGFSNGASTALAFAIRYPQRTNRIVIGSTFYNRSGAPSWFWEMMANPGFESMPQPYKDAFLAIRPDNDALYRMYERDVARMQSFPEFTNEEILSIRSPVMLILGDRDVVTTGHAVLMQEMLPGSRLAIIPGGHGDYIGELTTPHNPALIEATTSLINNFLSDK